MKVYKKESDVLIADDDLREKLNFVGREDNDIDTDDEQFCKGKKTVYEELIQAVRKYSRNLEVSGVDSKDIASGSESFESLERLCSFDSDSMRSV